MVGLIASAWSIFEIAIDSATINLAGIPEDYGLCFTSQVIGPARKIDAFIAVSKLRRATHLAKELEGFAKETTSLSERRNRVIHDPWHVVSGSIPKRYEISARKSFKFVEKEVDLDDLRRLYNDIQAHHMKLRKLVKQIEGSRET